MPPVRFFDDADMDHAVRGLLAGARYGTSEVGEVLGAVERVPDGDHDAWVDEWLALARRTAAVAAGCERRGRRVSAWGARLRAASYTARALRWVSPAADPQRHRDVWDEHRRAWARAIDLWPAPARAVALEVDDCSVNAWWFAPPVAPGPAPVVVLVPGLDTSVTDLVALGIADASSRGYGALVVEGPGQGASGIRDPRPLRPDWEVVAAAALEWLGAEPSADTRRLVLLGTSHGSLFAARAASRLGLQIAALVLDPGVLRLTNDDLQPLPPGARPADLVSFALADSDLAAIAVPVYVAEAEQARRHVGESAEAATRLRALGVAVHHDLFGTAEGAGAGSAPQVRNQRIFDWVDGLVGEGPR